ncbi:MAG: FHA domain-containing protein, partial [Planctomycetaceae bacterium]|nr:FHA domain-containing protein [Planctomycetaceae bacterium]
MARTVLVQQTPGTAPVRIPLDGDVVIGREADCRVILQDDLVSRHHARVSLHQGRVLVKDLGSTNGTTVAGARIKEQILKPGQSFTVGRTVFTVKEDGAADPTRATALPTQPGIVLTEAEEGSVYGTRSSEPPDRAKESATQPLTLEQMAALSQRLAALNRIGTALASILDVETLLAEVVEQVFGLFPRADRCCILMDRGGEIRPVQTKVRGRADPAAEIRISRTVLGLNRDERKAVLSFDTATDQRLSAAVSIVASGIRSIMSVPIFHKDDFYGILYLDTGDIGAPFSPDDLELLTTFAGQVAIFVKNARLVDRIQHETELRTNLGRYLSPNVVAEIARGNLIPSLGGETREGTCLFSDVVGFTRVCRSLSAAEVVSLLNRFFREQVDAVFRFEGTVDKFGGDAMLCVWGAPVPMKDHAGPAVSAALDMQNRLYGFNLALEASGSPVRIHMGIGLNSGSFIAGNVGSERRLEYTVIGDTVNLAQRVEEKATGGQVLVSDATRGLLRGARASRLKPTTIRGAAGSFLVHCVRAMPLVEEGRDRGLLASIPL